MPDLLWDDVRSFFDPVVTGSPPDARAPDTSVEDRQAVLDLVRSQGRSTSTPRMVSSSGCRALRTC
jgi:hypothetical protein